MEAIKIIVTMILFALVLLVLKKKVNFAISMTMLGLLGILVGSLLNGTTPMGDATTGVLFFDLFEFFKTVGLVDIITGPGLNMLTILGYVAYMDSLKASTLFALLASKPIARIRNKYLIVWISYLFAALLIFVIPNGNGRIALLFGTLYPVLLACGISKATAATTLFTGVMYLFGPTAATMYIGAGYMGYESFNLVEHFFKYAWPLAFSSIFVGSIVFVVTARFFDKREGAQSGNPEFSEMTPDNLGIPRYYAAFPCVPLVAMLFFGGMFSDLPVLSISTIMLMCFTVVFIYIVLISKNKTMAINDGFEWFKSLGKTLANIVSIVIGGTLFGQAILQIGGIMVILRPFIDAGNDINLPLFIVLTSLASLIIGAVSANNYVAMSILGPLYKTIAATSGASPDYLMIALCNIPQLSLGMSPATAHIALANQNSGVEIPTILKRAFLPLISSAMVYIVGICLLI